jgi:hypothetical protein
MKCGYCQMPSHNRTYCRKRRADQAQAAREARLRANPPMPWYDKIIMAGPILLVVSGVIGGFGSTGRYSPALYKRSAASSTTVGGG